MRSGLRLLLDQNVPVEVARWLKTVRPEWQVWHVNWVGLEGSDDSTIFRWAQDADAVVITFDEDFADARMYPPGTHAGVVRLRVWPTTIEECVAALSRLLEEVTEEDLYGALIIIDRSKIRIRRLPRS